MKKILISLIVSFIAGSLFAQTQSSSHLVFKGVSIDGTLSEYVSKMKQNGFNLIGIEDGSLHIRSFFFLLKFSVMFSVVYYAGFLNKLSTPGISIYPMAYRILH